MQNLSKKYSFLFLGNSILREHSLAKEIARRGYNVKYIEGMSSLASKIRNIFQNTSLNRKHFDDEQFPLNGGINSVEILTPPTVPTFLRSSWTPKIDALIFKFWFKKIAPTIDWENTIIIVMIPYWWYGFFTRNEYPAKFIIYDLYDSLEMPSRNSLALRRMELSEKLLVAQTDLLSYSAHEMKTRISTQYPDVKKIFIPNAVSSDYFQEEAEQNENSSTKTIGYVGFLDPRWADRELILKIASHFAKNRFLIRASAENKFITELKRYSNIELVGFLPYKQLYKTVSKFSVAIIPFLRNTITHIINPLKLYEYCALGIPIVAMRTKELEHYSDLIDLADTHEEFLRLIEKNLQREDLEKRKLRIKFARENTWKHRVDTLLQTIAEQLQ